MKMTSDQWVLAIGKIENFILMIFFGDKNEMLCAFYGPQSVIFIE